MICTDVLKSDFRTVNYILHIDMYCFRVAYTQIRLGVLPMNNNLRRYSDNPRERMCSVCTDSIENEQRFVYKVPLFCDLRRTCLGDTCNTPLIKLTEDRNKTLSRVIAKYVFNAVKRRHNFWT